MNLFFLVWKYIKAKPFNTSINIFLLALGVSVITLLLILNTQLQERIAKNAKGIDLVVGAKGSPLQLILCNVFHIDFPTGNIKLRDAEKISKNRLVKTSVPLALGDSYNGFRIVGTTEAFRNLYHLELQKGQWWDEELQVTIGATVANSMNLKPGDTFLSAHGISEGGHQHEDSDFIVSGILAPTYTVVDNLILTSVESIWHVHETHDEHNQERAETEHLRSLKKSPLIPSVVAGDSTKEITSLLIQYRSPMGAIQLPRLVNTQSALQAASPAFESARLFSILGVGIEVLTGFAFILIFISAVSIFVALYNALKERKYDMAIMRSMGASRAKLFFIILAESILLTIVGAAAGILVAHGIVAVLNAVVEEFQKGGISAFQFNEDEWIILAGSLLLGILCGLIPALQAYRTDISKTLSEAK